MRLNNLARENSAEDYRTYVKLLEGGGAILTVHYTGTDVPREAHLFFGEGEVGLVWAFVYEPVLYFNALEEGLDEEKAEVASRRMLGEIGEVENYLMGRKYSILT